MALWLNVLQKILMMKHWNVQKVGLVKRVKKNVWKFILNQRTIPMLPDNVTGKAVICFRMNTKIGMKYSLMPHIFYQITPLIQFIQDIIIWDCIKSNQEIIICITGMVLEFHILIHIQTVCFKRKGVEVALVSSLRINTY